MGAAARPTSTRREPTSVTERPSPPRRSGSANVSRSASANAAQSASGSSSRARSAVATSATASWVSSGVKSTLAILSLM
ncbi:Uncharacterised protein [Mycobacteroides abscessus subsp. abscessus]|nr:Uncharacterised protein [Mycobacteroides abscessus subsp. abscessus]